MLKSFGLAFIQEIMHRLLCPWEWRSPTSWAEQIWRLWAWPKCYCRLCKVLPEVTMTMAQIMRGVISSGALHRACDAIITLLIFGNLPGSMWYYVSSAVPWFLFLNFLRWPILPFLYICRCRTIISVDRPYIDLWIFKYSIKVKTLSYGLSF